MRESAYSIQFQIVCFWPINELAWGTCNLILAFPHHMFNKRLARYFIRSCLKLAAFWLVAHFNDMFYLPLK